MFTTTTTTATAAAGLVLCSSACTSERRSEGEYRCGVDEASEETVRVEPDGVREAEGNLAERRRARVSGLDRGRRTEAERCNITHDGGWRGDT